MDIEALKTQAKEYAIEAVKFDKLEEYSKAFDFYLKAVNQLQVIIKQEQNPNVRKTLIDEAKKYAIRAKAIREKKKEINPEKKLTDLLVKNPNVKWEEIFGLEKTKGILKEAILFKTNHLKSILLYGFPGCGKTLLAKAAGTEPGMNFIHITISDFLENSMIKNEKFMKELFDLARKNMPCIILFNEIESLIGNRVGEYTSKIKSEFLTEIGNVFNNNENILVLAKTSYPWCLSPEVIKIFHKKIYIPLPNLNQRKLIIEFNLKGTPNTLNNEELEDIAKKFEDFAGSNVWDYTEGAKFEPIKKCMNAEYFKKIPGKNGIQWNYTPCSEDEPGAIKMKLNELPDQNALLPPKVNYDDFINYSKSIRAEWFSFQKDLEKYKRFTEEFGEEG